MLDNALMVRTQEVEVNPFSSQADTNSSLLGLGNASSAFIPPPVNALLIAQNQLRHRQQQALLLTSISRDLMGPPSVFHPAAASLFPLNPHQTFHSAVNLYMPRDEYILSEPQILLRKQMEFFQATPADIDVVTPGRRKKISVGQVGIRCKHCARGLNTQHYVKGTMYFPSTLRALYQAAQNCGKVHLSDKCPMVSTEVKIQLKEYMEMPTSSGYGGKQYWSDCAMERGVCETENGLRFR